MLPFSKWIIQTPHYAQGENQQISQEKTSWFVMETIIAIYQHKKIFMPFDSVKPVSKKLFPPWLLQTNNKCFLKKQFKNYSDLMHWKQEMPLVSIVTQPVCLILILKVLNKMAHAEAP